MALIYWWLGLILLIGAAIILITRWFYLSKKTRKSAYVLAHTENFTALPEYIKAFKKYRLRLSLIFIFIIISLLAALLTSSRFISNTSDTQTYHARDIMLCLDISGSLGKIDIPVMKSFNTLVGRLKGERIGMTVFNTSPLTLMPLTDNYQDVQAVIASNIEDNLLTAKSAAIYPRSLDTSQIGVGLLGCAKSFDNQTQTRSRSIILVTDNETGSPAVVNFLQAATFAKEHNIHIFSLDTKTAQSFTNNGQDSSEMKQAALDTGGSYYDLTAGVPIPDIVNKIQVQQQSLTQSLPGSINSDQPDALLAVLGLSLILYIIAAWRYKL